MLSEILSVLNLSTMTLSTIGLDNQPHAAAVYFATDEDAFKFFFQNKKSLEQKPSNALALYFFSDPSSQHSQDLIHNPLAAITIQPDTYAWQDIRGLQMRGVVEIIPPSDLWEKAWFFYQQKFPFVLSLKPIVKRNLFYQFKPNWMRWIDNRKRLGYKKEWHL
ncbi:MAG: pyridoxamine 5'-phosphate oxidase family protein [Anaerolineales bacterium]